MDFSNNREKKFLDPLCQLRVRLLPDFRDGQVLRKRDRLERVEEVRHVPLGGIGDVELPVDRRYVDNDDTINDIWGKSASRFITFVEI
jgi:hypothetical protein